MKSDPSCLCKEFFKKYTLNIDLSQLNQVDENGTGTNTMLTVNELSYTLDPLRKNFKTD
jgi:lipopolysaccharide export system permease protein